MLRTYNFDAMAPDSLDPHLTLLGPIANVHSAIFSRVLAYDDEVRGTIIPDLAESIPEQPDELTYVVKLRRGVTFHNIDAFKYLFAQTAGRELTADDVKASIERQLAPNSPRARRFARAGQWDVVDAMDVRDRYTLAIRLKSPVAPFLSFLAGRHAFVVARDTADVNDEMNDPLRLIGTGPFVLTHYERERTLTLLRNPSWFRRDDNVDGAGLNRPFIDGYVAHLSPQEDLFQKVWFERMAVDSTSFLDPAALEQAQATNLADITLEETDGGGMLAARLLLDRPPFNDDRARRAIHLAIDRQAIIDLVYPDMSGRPSARLSGPVAPVMSRWAIDAATLAQRPGYRTAREEREEDMRTARELWRAAFADQPVELKVLCAGMPKTIAEKALPPLQRQLQDALGVTVTPTVDASGYAVIASALGRNIDGATEGIVHFTLMLEDGGVDLDDWIYPFHSGQPANTYRLEDSTFDGMVDKTRREFDGDERRKLGLDAQDYLLGRLNARIDICAPVQRRLSWGYVRNSRLPIWNGADGWLADVWLDTSHPAWKNRPA